MARDTLSGMWMAKFQGSELRTARDTILELETAGGTVLELRTAKNNVSKLRTPMNTVPGMGKKWFRGSKLMSAGHTVPGMGTLFQGDSRVPGFQSGENREY
jgi:hypothetical protein